MHIILDWEVRYNLPLGPKRWWIPTYKQLRQPQEFRLPRSFQEHLVVCCDRCVLQIPRPGVPVINNGIKFQNKCFEWTFAPSAGSWKLRSWQLWTAHSEFSPTYQLSNTFLMFLLQNHFHELQDLGNLLAYHFCSLVIGLNLCVNFSHLMH